MSNQTAYDATRDPRTGRPVLPIDEDNTRKAEAESLPLTDEDNQGIDIGDDDAVGEEDDLPRETAQSSVDVNATVPRMKAAGSETDEMEFGDELTDEETTDEEGAEGERPEALAKFAEVARNHDGKPVRTGTEATAETSPIPADSESKAGRGNARSCGKACSDRVRAPMKPLTGCPTERLPVAIIRRANDDRKKAAGFSHAPRRSQLRQCPWPRRGRGH